MPWCINLLQGVVIKWDEVDKAEKYELHSVIKSFLNPNPWYSTASYPLQDSNRTTHNNKIPAKPWTWPTTSQEKITKSWKNKYLLWHPHLIIMLFDNLWAQQSVALAMTLPMIPPTTITQRTNLIQEKLEPTWESTAFLRNWKWHNPYLQ